MSEAKAEVECSCRARSTFVGDSYFVSMLIHEWHKVHERCRDVKATTAPGGSKP